MKIRIDGNRILTLALLASGLLGLTGSANAQTNAPEKNDETIVVYPASATSKKATTIGLRRAALPPVQEEEDCDVDTPIGQIRLVLQRLDEIKAAVEADSIGADEETLAALGEIRAMIEERAEPKSELKPEPKEKDGARDPKLWWALGALALLIVWTKRREVPQSVGNAERTARPF